MLAACSGSDDDPGGSASTGPSGSETVEVVDGPFSRIDDEAFLAGEASSTIAELTAPAAGFGWLAAGQILDPQGSRAVVWTSPDGLTWDAEEIGGEADSSAAGVAVRQGLAVTVGRSGEGPDADAGVWVSTDGQAWRPVPSEALGGQGRQVANDVAATDEGIVVIGSEVVSDSSVPVVWVSEDGEGWTRTDMPAEEGEFMAAVTAGPAGFVVVGGGGDDGLAWASADGQEWRRIAAPTFAGPRTQYLSDVASNANGYTAVGVNAPEGPPSPASWTSTDGINWSEPSGSFPEPEDDKFSVDK